jgi:hypothetical protein
VVRRERLVQFHTIAAVGSFLRSDVSKDDDLEPVKRIHIRIQPGGRRQTHWGSTTDAQLVTDLPSVDCHLEKWPGRNERVAVAERLKPGVGTERTVKLHVRPFDAG